jgi:hypothetical protein
MRKPENTHPNEKVNFISIALIGSKKREFLVCFTSKQNSKNLLSTSILKQNKNLKQNYAIFSFKAKK